MYRTIVYDCTEVISSVVFGSRKAAIEFASMGQCLFSAIGAAVYRIGDDGRTEELVKFFDFV